MLYYRYPVNKYMLKVNKRNSRNDGILNTLFVNFEHILLILLVVIL